MVTNKAS